MEDYEYSLSISTDKDFHLHLRRDPKSCFVNNYFSEGLMSWEANIDIQPVYNYYKAVTYMCAYFSKCEDKCSVAMKETLNQAKESESSKFEMMTNIAKAYNSNRECSVQEAVYLIMPELWLRKCFPAVYFVNTNLPDQRYRIFKSQNEVEELAEDSEEVFKRNMLDRYSDRPNALYMQGKYAVLNDMCYATFCANYVLDTKKTIDNNDWQPVVLDETVNETNHDDLSFPKSVPLMSSKEKLKCRKVPKVLRYYTPNQHKFPEKYAHHILMLFYPFRSEETDLKLSDSYVLKLNEPAVIEVVNRNKHIFEPDADLVELVLQNYRDDLEHNQDHFAQQENEEVIELINENLEEEPDEVFDDSENHGTFTNRTHDLLSDVELSSCLRSLNQKQREIFDVVLTWGKQFIQNSNIESVNIEPLQIFLSGSGGVGKSHLIKCIYNSLSKILMYKKEDLEKPRVIKLAPTGIASINIQGTTIHTGLNIPINAFRGLTDKQRTSVRNKLQYVEMIIIDEISMVSSTLLLNIHKRLCEIFGVVDEKPFAGKSILVCGDLYQLPPVMAKSVFDTDGLMISVFKLWHLFKLAELSESMRQRGDTVFIDLLNNIRVGEIDVNDENLIKSRFISVNHSDYPWDALHLFAENSAVNRHNLHMLNSLPTENVRIVSIDSLPRTFTERECDRVKTLKQSDTGGLAAELDLKIGARVMLVTNIDIEDRLINGQLGTVLHFSSRINRVEIIYVKFDDNTAGMTLQSKDRYAVSCQSVPIERSEATFSLNKRNISSPIIKRTQFPLMLSYACTVHKVQGLTMDRAVISFDLERQRNFNPGQMYVAMSRVKSIHGLYFTGQYSASAFTCNSRVSTEYARLRKKENQLPPLKDFQLSDASLIISLLNVRSLKLHSIDIVNDNFLECSNILCFTETQIGYDHRDVDIQEIQQNLNRFKISFNNDQHKYSSMAICHQEEDINVSEYDHTSGFSLMKFKKDSFSDKELPGGPKKNAPKILF